MPFCRVTVLTNGPTILCPSWNNVYLAVLYPRGESFPGLTPVSDRPSPKGTTIGKGQDPSYREKYKQSRNKVLSMTIYVRGK